MTDVEGGATAARSVSTLEDFVDAIEIEAIRTLRVSGELKSDAEEVPAGEEPAMTVFRRDEPHQLETRCVLIWESTEARMLADVSVVMRYGEPLDVPEELLAEVSNQISVMTAYPYLRELIQTTASRLGIKPPIMGLLRPQRVEMQPAEVDDPRDIATLTPSE